MSISKTITSWVGRVWAGAIPGKPAAEPEDFRRAHAGDKEAQRRIFENQKGKAWWVVDTGNKPAASRAAAPAPKTTPRKPAAAAKGKPNTAKVVKFIPPPAKAFTGADRTAQRLKEKHSVAAKKTKPAVTSPTGMTDQQRIAKKYPKPRNLEQRVANAAQELNSRGVAANAHPLEASARQLRKRNSF